MKRKTNVLIACLAAATLLLICYHNRIFSSRLHGNKRKPATPAETIISQQNAIPENFRALYQKNIAQREYHITWDKDKNCLQSPNRKQNLRAYYQPGVFKVQNRIDSTGNNFRLTLTTTGIYADGKKLYFPSKTGISDIAGNNLLLKHSGFAEEYINNEQGIRQNFIIDTAPSGTKKLQVRLIPEGLDVNNLPGNKLEFYSEKNGLKTTRLFYDSLKCWDANGEELIATLAYRSGRVMIEVDVAEAIYPVTIDPIITKGNPANPGNADLVLEGFQSGAQFGTSVSSAGDVNGDGFSDVIVGAPYYFDNEVNQGAFFLFMGSSDGLQNNGLPFTGPIVKDSYFGKSVATAGDVNGDGFSDVIIGAPGMKAAFIYYGSANGLNQIALKLDIAQSTAAFGCSVNTVGDINADGFSDVVVGARSYSNGQMITGAAFIFEGAAAGLNNTASDTLTCNDPGAEFGHAVASAGDVNGDGHSDLIIGAPYYHTQPNVNAGGAFIYNGSPTGISHNPATTLHGKHALSRFGYSVSSAGDFNGDGFSDVIVGASTYTDSDQNQGAYTLFLGHVDGSGLDPLSEELHKGSEAFFGQGQSVASAGDFNADGFGDIIYGIPGSSGGNFQKSGRIVICHGSKADNIKYGDGNFIKPVEQNFAQMGTSVASAGDVNGDGYADIVTGIPFYDKSGLDDGIALISYGAAEKINAYLTPNFIYEGDQQDAHLGSSISSAGDVNSDGYDDLLVGTPYYDNGSANEGICYLFYGSLKGVNIANAILIEMNQAEAEFGGAVSGAGDVNGDGFDDIIIGARHYDMPGYQNSGAGFVFYGSASGIQLAITNVVYFPLANAFSGNSVSGAGDVDGDGFDDVIVGVPNYANGQQKEGAAIISMGSPTGIATGAGLILESNQANSEFGCSVSTAGDVNGDGYDEILVGAKYFDINSTVDEGACFVYYGTKAGVTSNNFKILHLNKADANFGCSVSNAGDVNGDGYDDVIAGATGYKEGSMNVGAAEVFYGAATGLSEANAAIIIGTQADAEFGSHVAAADLNGDGYSEIIVTVPYYDNFFINQGAVLVYAGSEYGIDVKDASLTIERNGPVLFGRDGSSAGDINGDGYEDLIISALDEKTNNFDNGVLYVFHGNDDKLVTNPEKLKNNVNLYNPNLTTRLNESNNTESQFGIGLSVKPFLGRNRSKLVWEVRKPGESFSHNSPITNSVQSSGEGDFENVQFATSELKKTIVKSAQFTKIRVRAKYDPTLAITGQVYGPWRYVNKKIITDLSVFPVELISFQAKVTENLVNLTWSTATEVNSDHFEIQRSSDGKTWINIGEVPAMQNSSEKHQYTFSDNTPLTGTSYYRLKMIDLDGTFAYSHIDSVDIKSKLTFYPNPTPGPLQIDSEEQVKEISVYNNSGTKVMSLQNAHGLKSIDLGRLPAGKYLVHVNGQVVHVVKK